MSEPAFKVGGIVDPPYFVGRDDDLGILFRSLSNLSQNVLLLAPRRFGKSSLLHNLRQELDAQENLLIPSVNCLEMTSYADFHRATVSALLKEFERKHRVKGLLKLFRISIKEKILTAVRRLEEIGGSIAELGTAYLKFRESDIDELELLRESFQFFRSFSEEKKVQIVFLLDEFQEIASFNGSMFKLLKKEMDENPNTKYLFSGSSIRMLSKIFLSDDAPLYLMASRHRLESLDEATVSEFVTERFEIAGYRTTPEVASLLHSLTGGIPFYVQKLGFLTVQHLLINQLRELVSDSVQSAFSAMLLELGSEFEARWVNRFSTQQRQIVKSLAQLGNGSVTDIANIMGVNRSKISSSLRRLRDMMVISTGETSKYSLTDVVFQAWLQQT